MGALRQLWNLGSSYSWDIDALSIINAIQNDPVSTTLTLTQKQAINWGEIFKKTYNLNTKIVCDYGFIGGTANAHKYNYKDPRNLDAAFRITWGGVLTHTVEEVTPGASGWGNTHCIPLDNFTTNDFAVIFSTNNLTHDGNTNVGVWDGSNLNGLQIDIQYSGNAYGRINSNNFTAIAASSPKGIHAFVRNDSSGVSYYKNGIFVAKSTDVSSNRSQYPIGLFCLNQSTAPTSFSITPSNSILICKGLTATEVYNLTIMIDTRNTIINRHNTQIWNDYLNWDDSLNWNEIN